MSDFSLRQRVLEFLDKSPEADPRSIADDVFASLSPYEVWDALQAALPPYVRVMAHRDRPSVPKLVERAERLEERPANWSPWVESVQRGALKNTRWYVSKQWKFLYQLERPDLEELIREAGLSEANFRAKRQGLQRLLTLMETTEAITVGQLSDLDIAAALAGMEVSNDRSS